jgi:hypothetical protein
MTSLELENLQWSNFRGLYTINARVPRRSLIHLNHNGMAQHPPFVASDAAQRLALKL